MTATVVIVAGILVGFTILLVALNAAGERRNAPDGGDAFSGWTGSDSDSGSDSGGEANCDAGGDSGGGGDCGGGDGGGGGGD